MMNPKTVVDNIEAAERAGYDRCSRMWANELSAIRQALREAGEAEPITFEVIAQHLRFLAEDIRRPLRDKVSRWFRNRDEMLAQFGVSPGHKVRERHLDHLAFDDRRKAWWQISDAGASLVYTFEPIEDDEIFFGEGTDYFVDNCFDVWRAHGLVLAVANLAIGGADILVVLDEAMEVTEANPRPGRSKA